VMSLWSSGELHAGRWGMSRDANPEAFRILAHPDGGRGIARRHNHPHALAAVDTHLYGNVGSYFSARCQGRKELLSDADQAQDSAGYGNWTVKHVRVWLRDRRRSGRRGPECVKGGIEARSVGWKGSWRRENDLWKEEDRHPGPHIDRHEANGLQTPRCPFGNWEQTQLWHF
jgi:hypothetical protein